MLNDLYHTFNPIAFSLGPFVVRWYGLAYVLGFICAAFVLRSIARRWNIKITLDNLIVILICIIVGTIFGARLGYCIFYGNGFYLFHPEEIIMLNHGGMSFHGGLIGAILSGCVAAKITRIPYLCLLDLGAIAAPIGLFFGRCANFINGELWGNPSNLPWAVVFGGNSGTMARHPSQLYEALLEGVILFCVLYALSRKRPPLSRGSYFGLFLLLYGAFRFLIEFFRSPDTQLGYLFGSSWLTMGQLLSIPLIVAGVVLIIFANKRGHYKGHNRGKNSGHKGIVQFHL